MKGIFLTLILLSYPVIFSQIKYVSSLEDAFSLAQKENKNVLIKYYSENCSHCQKLQQVLEIDSIQQFVNLNFISYKIESEQAPQSDYVFLKKSKIFIENVPALLFFDPQKQFIHLAQPKQEAELVMKALKTALDPFERTSNLAKRYQDGTRDMVTLKRYSKLAQVQKDSAVVNQLANDIYNLFPKEQLLSKNSIVNTAGYVKTIHNGFFRFWMDNYSKLDSVAPDLKKEDKEKVFKDILMDYINAPKTKWDIQEYQKVRSYIQITYLSENPYGFFWEEESQLLVKNGLQEQAFELAEKQINFDKNKQHSFVYEFNVYSNLLTASKELKALVKLMDELFPTITDNELKGKMYCYYLRIYKKLNDTKSYEKLKAMTKDFLSKHQLDTSLFDEVSK